MTDNSIEAPYASIPNLNTSAPPPLPTRNYPITEIYNLAKIAIVLDFDRTVNIKHTIGTTFNNNKLQFPELFKRSHSTTADNRNSAPTTLQTMASEGLVFINSRGLRSKLIDLFSTEDNESDNYERPFILDKDYIYGACSQPIADTYDKTHARLDIGENTDEVKQAWADTKKTYNESILTYLVENKYFGQNDFVIFFDDTYNNVKEVININANKNTSKLYPTVIGVCQCMTQDETCAPNTAKLIEKLLTNKGKTIKDLLENGRYTDPNPTEPTKLTKPTKPNNINLFDLNLKGIYLYKDTIQSSKYLKAWCRHLEDIININSTIANYNEDNTILLNQVIELYYRIISMQNDTKIPEDVKTLEHIKDMLTIVQEKHYVISKDNVDFTFTDEQINISINTKVLQTIPIKPIKPIKPVCNVTNGKMDIAIKMHKRGIESMEVKYCILAIIDRYSANPKPVEYKIVIIPAENINPYKDITTIAAIDADTEHTKVDMLKFDKTAHKKLFPDKYTTIIDKSRLKPEELYENINAAKCNNIIHDLNIIKYNIIKFMDAFISNTINPNVNNEKFIEYIVKTITELFKQLSKYINIQVSEHYPDLIFDTTDLNKSPPNFDYILTNKILYLIIFDAIRIFLIEYITLYKPVLHNNYLNGFNNREGSGTIKVKGTSPTSKKNKSKYNVNMLYRLPRLWRTQKRNSSNISNRALFSTISNAESNPLSRESKSVPRIFNSKGVGGNNMKSHIGSIGKNPLTAKKPGFLRRLFTRKNKK